MRCDIFRHIREMAVKQGYNFNSLVNKILIEYMNNHHGEATIWLSSLKEKVIELLNEGRGRNEITDFLNSCNIPISLGSVSNITNTFKAENPDLIKTLETKIKEHRKGRGKGKKHERI